MEQDSASSITTPLEPPSRLAGEILVNPLPSQRIIIWLLIAWCLVIAVVALNTSFQRRMAVPGWIEPINGLQRLHNTGQGGTVSKLLVHNGEKVVAGQPLLKLRHKRELNEAEAALEAQLIDNQNRLRQHSHELANEYQQQRASLHAQQYYIEEEIALLETLHEVCEEKLHLAQRQLKQRQQLHQRRVIADIELESARMQLLALRQEMAEIAIQQQRMHREKQHLHAQITALSVQHQQQLMALESEQRANQQQLIPFQHLEQTTLYATQNGTVQNLTFREGDYVFSQQYLLSISEQTKDLTAYAVVAVEAAGQVTQDMETRIKYHAFPYQEYGNHLGTIRLVSDTVILPGDKHSVPIPITQPSYLIEIALPHEQDNHRISLDSLRSGMTFVADISTGEWHLTSWLLAPLRQIGRVLSWKK